MVPTVRGKSGKVWEFYNPKAGGNEILRESRGKSKYQGAKVNRCRKKFELFYTDCIQQLKKKFSVYFARRLSVSPLYNLFSHLCF